MKKLFLGCGCLVLVLGFGLRPDRTSWGCLALMVAVSLPYPGAVYSLGIWLSACFERPATVMVVLLMISYSPHFAITVTDPINVMSRGMVEKSYNLEVAIPELRKSDDVFRLARAYNEEYLPLKERSAGEEEGMALDIKIDDISDLLGG